MSWNEIKHEDLAAREESRQKAKSDRSFLHGILIVILNCGTLLTIILLTRIWLQCGL